MLVSGRVPKIEVLTTHLYKLYGYGLWYGKTHPRNSLNYKVQETLHFRYLKLFGERRSISRYSTSWWFQTHLNKIFANMSNLPHHHKNNDSNQKTRHPFLAFYADSIQDNLDNAGRLKVDQVPSKLFCDQVPWANPSLGKVGKVV